MADDALRRLHRRHLELRLHRGGVLHARRQLEHVHAEEVLVKHPGAGPVAIGLGRRSSVVDSNGVVGRWSLAIGRRPSDLGHLSRSRANREGHDLGRAAMR